MGNKGSKEGGQQTKVQDKIPSESPLGKMLKYWDDSPHTKGKKKQRMTKCCCFIWTQELILKPLWFWPKFGSDEHWVCQLLIEHINDKSPVTHEEMEYALYWRQSPVVLFPLKEKEKRKKKAPSNWDLLSPLSPLITLLLLWLRCQSWQPPAPHFPHLTSAPFQLPSPPRPWFCFPMSPS
jgi:hypothetical protein